MMTDDTALYRRFLRTVRVATHTALAEYELAETRRAGGVQARFQALAAKGPGAWRFPDSGLAAADGLLTARLERDAAGLPSSLILQADGAAGLDSWAARSARIAIGPLVETDVVFDSAGRATVALAALMVEEDELAGFSVSLVDGP
jgi:hypothetical protein